jgi:hypothetical protein
MYGFDYPERMNVGRVCLEMSLKPFKSMEQAEIEKVCIELFDQWKELLLRAKGCAVMLWVGDGSEILEYNRDMKEPLEWGRYLGLANPPMNPGTWDPRRMGLHSTPRYYTGEPAVITYGDLRRITGALKTAGEKYTGFPAAVGATFDPGPEFAVSPFKFQRHREISEKHMADLTASAGWVHCTAVLHGEARPYAAFPQGIPEGLPLGTFLGAQYKIFAEDLGFDYIWFSNGFGFSRDSWSWTGECFDGGAFLPGAAERVSGQILEFWNLFTQACPGVRIETRGSNLSTGMDIAAHGSPLSSIYPFLPFAPPNSPWAALDAQFGLELAGYMSHIAETPPEGFLFRYYTHDPWWVNSPWFDRYNRQPHDIYLPLAVARLDENLRVTPPYGVNFLTADDSFGNMPRRCPVEVIPHILEAYSHYPDRPGPVTWVYPFAQYHRIGRDSGRAGEVLFGDWFIKSGLDAGMPLNTVISDTNFLGAQEKLSGRTVLVLPVPDGGSPIEGAVLGALSNRADILLYGPVDHASGELLSLLGLRTGDPKEGDFTISSALPGDRVLHGTASKVLRHRALVSGGGLNTFFTGGAELAVSAAGEGRDYAYAVFNSGARGGRLAWVRGSFPAHDNAEQRLPKDFEAGEFFPPGSLLREILVKFGISLNFTRYDVNDRPPMALYSVNGNACYITGYAPDTTCSMRLSLPDGAPVMTGTDCIIRDSTAEYTLNRWWHNECRTFVRQKAESKVSNIVRPSVFPGIDRRMYLTGLIDAEVVFRKAPGGQPRLVQFPSGCGHGDSDKFLETNTTYEELSGDRLLVRGVSGSLMIAWGEYEPYRKVYGW